jgi:2-polyprenyl-6-methoxyphenol hydroxylase-like FAD-dependent oxidoreductase
LGLRKKSLCMQLMTTTTCCIVGGGPAGIMLGYLLARAGVKVTVLEKHRDFFRDFRGDTVHPSTLEVFAELGLADDLLKLPHQKISRGGLLIGDFETEVVDFRHLPVRHPFIALMPQWDFLDFLAGRARHFPTFCLEMEHEATDLVTDSGRVIGVICQTPAGERTIRAELVVACDGRHSTTRRSAGFEVVETGAPIDVLWFRINRHPADIAQLLGRVNYGKALILINREDYFQAGLIIKKGSFDQLKEQGLQRFQEALVQLAPFLQDRVGELRDWEQIKLLTVQINHLRQWYRPGLLCIGDAAHAMSPAGGVGINVAIQDAVAAARILAGTLRAQRSTDDVLPRVQRRREPAVRLIQFVQKQAHDRLARVFDNPGPLQAPWQLKITARLPGSQRLVGRLIGIGPRPEHVRPPRTRGIVVAVACGLGAALAVFGTRRLLRQIQT